VATSRATAGAATPRRKNLKPDPPPRLATIARAGGQTPTLDYWQLLPSHMVVLTNTYQP
jgi:hypothetical protein